jgi:hypothetical protein
MAAIRISFCRRFFRRGGLSFNSFLRQVSASGVVHHVNFEKLIMNFTFLVPQTLIDLFFERAIAIRAIIALAWWKWIRL